MEEDALPDEAQTDWRTPTQRMEDIEQAKELRQQASQGGLRFQVYLPAELAGWVLGLVERGVFTDPSEAVFVMLQEQHDLAPHADLRDEILRRSLAAASADPSSGLSGDELKEHLDRLLAEPRREPAVWRQRPAT